MPIEFSNGTMLWSLLALAIPIAIHLISRHQHRRLSFGLVRLIPEAKLTVQRRIKLTQKVLLSVRLLLLVALSLMLAGISCQPRDVTPDQVALVTSGWLNDADDAQRQALLDRKRQHGDALQVYLDNGDERLTLQALETLPTKVEQRPRNTWFQARQFLDDFLAGLKDSTSPPILHVYSSARASQFAGHLVALPQSTEWHLAEKPETSESKPHIQPLAVHLLSVGYTQRQQLMLNAAIDGLNRLASLSLKITHLSAEQGFPIDQRYYAVVHPSNVELQVSIPEIPLFQIEPENLLQIDFPLQLSEEVLKIPLLRRHLNNSWLSREQIESSASVKPTKPVAEQNDPSMRDTVDTPTWLLLFIATLFMLERVLSEYRSGLLTRNVQ